MAEMTVTGVLITRAQGQAITSIARARYSQPRVSGVSKNGALNSSGGTTATSAASTVTAGV